MVETSSGSNTRPELDEAEIRAGASAVEAARTNEGPGSEQHLQSLAGLGQSYLSAGDAPKALTQFEEGLTASRTSKSPHAEARFWGLKGRALQLLGNNQMARQALAQSLHLAEKNGQTALTVDTLLQLARLDAAAGQQPRAIAKAERAFGLALQANESTRVVVAAVELGDLFRAMEAPEKAHEYYNDGLVAARRVGDLRAQSGLNIRLGDLLITEGDHEAAQEHYELALNEGTNPPDTAQQVGALSGLVHAHMGAGNVEVAMFYGDQAIEITQRHEDTAAEIGAIARMAQQLIDVRQESRAMSYLERGLKLAREHDDWDAELALLSQLGDARYSAGAYDQALEPYEQAFQTAERLQDKPTQISLLGRIAAVIAELRGPEAALPQARTALDLARETEDPRVIGEQELLVAITLLECGDKEQGHAACHRAVEQFEKAGNPQLVEQALAVMGTDETRPA